jgi:hypothetical protein
MEPFSRQFILLGLNSPERIPHILKHSLRALRVGVGNCRATGAPRCKRFWVELVPSSPTVNFAFSRDHVNLPEDIVAKIDAILRG